MSCAWIAPPEYAPDSGLVAPPYLVPHTEDPAFESTLQYNVNDAPTFKIVVADADLKREVQVRFCLRGGSKATDNYLLATTPAKAEPTPEHTAERKPIVSDPIAVCNRFLPNADSRFLYVIVAPRAAFPVTEIDCELPEPGTYNSAFWRFTCDKPE